MSVFKKFIFTLQPLFLFISQEADCSSISFRNSPKTYTVVQNSSDISCEVNTLYDLKTHNFLGKTAESISLIPRKAGKDSWQGKQWKYEKASRTSTELDSNIWLESKKVTTTWPNKAISLIEKKYFDYSGIFPKLKFLEATEEALFLNPRNGTLLLTYKAQGEVVLACEFKPL